MKKIIISLLIVAIMFIPMVSIAYSGDSYEIQVPESFKSELNNYMENYWGDENGNSVNIQMSEIKSANEFQYSEEFLNALIEEVKNNIGEHKEEIRKGLTEQFETGLSAFNVSKEEIEKYVNEMVEKVEYKEFLVKEVTTFTKNNYPCLHYISNLAMGEQSTYTETYQLVSDKTAYTLTVSSSDPSFFDKQEVKDMVNSFTIKDYKEYAFAKKKSKNAITSILVFAVIGLIGGAISGISKAINDKKLKNKNNKEEK